MSKNYKNLNIVSLAINFTVSVTTALYLYLGHHKKFFNSSLKKYVLGSYFENTVINLHYTIFSTRIALQFCSNTILKNGVTMLICASPYASRFEPLKIKNVNFWLGKWSRGALSNYKFSSRKAIIIKKQKFKVRLKRFKFPSFIVIVDPLNLNQSICKEAKYLGVFSFVFLDTSSKFSHASYWALANTKSYSSIKFYYSLIKSVVLKSKLIKTQKFLKFKNAASY